MSNTDIMGTFHLHDGDGNIDTDITDNSLHDMLNKSDREIYDKLLDYLSNKNITDNLKFTNFIKFIDKNKLDIVLAVRAMREAIESGPYLDTLEGVANLTLKNDIMTICFRLGNHIDDNLFPSKSVAWNELWNSVLNASIRDYWALRINKVIDPEATLFYGCNQLKDTQGLSFE